VIAVEHAAGRGAGALLAVGQGFVAHVAGASGGLLGAFAHPAAGAQAARTNSSQPATLNTYIKRIYIYNLK